MATKTQHGYLVLADISGYTSFLAGVELDHADEILTALLETIVDKFRTMLTIAKLEGDAVFAYVPEAKVSRGETLLELIESTYRAFREHVEAAHRRTTCECNACRAIPTLDLKFMTHHGDYILQQESGIHELVGTDVNLVHRLMKNHIIEATGWKAYALFTNQSLEHMGLLPDGMHEQTENYEHLGPVRTFSLDLRRRYKELKDNQPVYLAAAEADYLLVRDLAAPPPVVWDWLNESGKRVRWGGFDEFKWLQAPGSRTGVGARSHCVHNKKIISAETVQDWRPFDYFTLETGDSLQTYELEPLASGQRTRLHLRFRAKMPLPAVLRRLILAAVMRANKMEEALALLESLVSAGTLAEAAAAAA